MNANEDVKIQRSVQRLPSVSSEISYDSHSVHKSKTNNEKKVLTTYKNKQHSRELGGETMVNTLKKGLSKEMLHLFVMDQKGVFFLGS